MAFLQLTESKLKNWTIKYGTEATVQQIFNQYRTFVSKNKIFQEFNKAFIEFQQVCGEYEAYGDISKIPLTMYLDFTHLHIKSMISEAKENLLFLNFYHSCFRQRRNRDVHARNQKKMGNNFH